MEERILEIHENEVPILKGYDRIYVITQALAIDKKAFMEKYIPFLVRYGAIFAVTDSELKDFKEIKTTRYPTKHVYLIGVDKKNTILQGVIAIVIALIALGCFLLIIPYLIMIPLIFLSLWSYVSIFEALIMSILWPYPLIYIALYNRYPGSKKHF